MKVNLSSSKTIMYSYFNKRLHEKDWATIKEWQEIFINGRMDVSNETLQAYNQKPMDEDKEPKEKLNKTTEPGPSTLSVAKDKTSAT